MSSPGRTRGTDPLSKILTESELRELFEAIKPHAKMLRGAVEYAEAASGDKMESLEQRAGVAHALEIRLSTLQPLV